MEREPPRATSDEIDLYIRTYYSLLRSSGDVRVRSFEEAHIYSESSLHAGARETEPDVAAFAYSAARLPVCMPGIKRIVLGQSKEQFESAGFNVREWTRVTTRGRRRPMRWDSKQTLACFLTSSSDIDDLIPIVTAYQIEWNKLHTLLNRKDALQQNDLDVLSDAFSGELAVNLARVEQAPLDLNVRLLSASLVEYQRAAQRWWSEVEPVYLGSNGERRPVYFVSSNTHVLANLFGGYARLNRNTILEFARNTNPENLAPHLEQAIASGDEHEIANCSYYLLHKWLNQSANSERSRAVQLSDEACGITTIPSPGHIDVTAQIIELSKLDPLALDPRIAVDDLALLRKSDALILNIDYPLGMAAYHLLSRLAQGVRQLRGVYVMGKAATLNGKVGDVMIGGITYDAHSENTFLFRNCFSGADLQPYVRNVMVLDGQKAVTVRGSFLQNRKFMNVFYRDAYTVLEMEAGPYLSAIYEMVYPKRHPSDEIVHLSTLTSFDVGILHYASDTPYSRRQNLLSKSLSYFGVDGTYACGTAIARRILSAEIARLR